MSTSWCSTCWWSAAVCGQPLMLHPSKCVVVTFPSSRCCICHVKLELWKGHSCELLWETFRQFSVDKIVDFSDTIMDLRTETSVVTGDLGHLVTWSWGTVSDAMAVNYRISAITDEYIANGESAVGLFLALILHLLRSHPRVHNQMNSVFCKWIHPPTLSIRQLFRQSLVNSNSIFSRNVVKIPKKANL